MQRHPATQWVLYAPTTQGIVVKCEVCGEQGAVGSYPQVDLFAQRHREHRSAAPGHYGAGDAIAAATKRLGIDTCTPCERRRQQLNGLLPRVWRR